MENNDRIQQILDSLKKGENPPTLDTSKVTTEKIVGLKPLNEGFRISRFSKDNSDEEKK